MSLKESLKKISERQHDVWEAHNEYEIEWNRRYYDNKVRHRFELISAIVIIVIVDTVLIIGIQAVFLPVFDQINNPIILMTEIIPIVIGGIIVLALEVVGVLMIAKKVAPVIDIKK